jgi:hypothetical protein
MADNSNSSGGEFHTLVIVESPAKCKTITSYLGAGYKVIASMGHIRDLPLKEIGVNLDDLEKGNFECAYEVTDRGKDIVAKIKALTNKPTMKTICTVFARHHPPEFVAPRSLEARCTVFSHRDPPEFVAPRGLEAGTKLLIGRRTRSETNCAR